MKEKKKKEEIKRGKVSKFTFVMVCNAFAKIIIYVLVFSTQTTGVLTKIKPDF